ncbi:hypothetical protein B4U80_12811 [Leptotrombidium deliense]|uniref:Uncharacterized protein n=1 Tax=Leptotrombidium deliense TaxID=299467 RepID=A0A443SKW7_9ACAR|nr:hypothetical protein B4U80_12811 [Leptotrombidium deliense]
MSCNGKLQKRKSRKPGLPAIVDAVNIDCSNRHTFCLNCIQLYSRIDSTCPLCATEYTCLVNVDTNKATETTKTKNVVFKPQLTEEEKREYIEYLETVSDLSSEEDTDTCDLPAEKAERCIRNRVKQLKRQMNCRGVNCNSKECLTGEHDDECSDSIEEFHVGDYEWKEVCSTIDNSGKMKKLKREKTFEELLDECEQFVENAIKDEEQ